MQVSSEKNFNEEISKFPINQEEEKYLISNEINESNQKHNSQIIGETPYRWFISFMFFFLAFSNGIQWLSISSIATSFGKNYDLNVNQVNLVSLIYMIAYPIVSPFSSYIIDNCSTRFGVSNFFKNKLDFSWFIFYFIRRDFKMLYEFSYLLPVFRSNFLCNRTAFYY